MNWHHGTSIHRSTFLAASIGRVGQLVKFNHRYQYFESGLNNEVIARSTDV